MNDIIMATPNMELEIVEKKWGREIIITNHLLYCSKILELNQDYRCSIHCHKIKHETFYILDGCCLMEWFCDMDNMCKKVFMPGTVLMLRPNTYHRFSGIAKSTRILEISTTDHSKDSYRVTTSEYVSNGSRDWAKNEIYIG